MTAAPAGYSPAYSTLPWKHTQHLEMKTLSELVNILLEMLSATAQSHFYNYLGLFLIAFCQSKLTKKDLWFQKPQVSEQISEDYSGKSGHQSGEMNFSPPTPSFIHRNKGFLLCLIIILRLPCSFSN